MAFNLLPQNKCCGALSGWWPASRRSPDLAGPLVPPPLKSQVEKIAGEVLGRKVTLGRVEANYANGIRANALNDTLKEEKALTKPNPDPWKLEVAAVAVRNGLVTWRDDTTAPQALVALRDLALDAKEILLPLEQPVQFSGSTAVQGGPASLKFERVATDKTAQVSVNLADWPLGLPAPYLGQLLVPGLHGNLDSELDVNWRQKHGQTRGFPQAAQPDRHGQGHS